MGTELPDSEIADVRKPEQNPYETPTSVPSPTLARRAVRPFAILSLLSALLACLVALPAMLLLGQKSQIGSAYTHIEDIVVGVNGRSISISNATVVGASLAGSASLLLLAAILAGVSLRNLRHNSNLCH